MKVLVTGAGGFVGRTLTRLLAADHEIVALDTSCAGLTPSPNLKIFEADLTDPDARKKAIADGCDALIHLATIPGGGAEQDPDRAWQVNMEASQALISAVAQHGDHPRVVYASSIAVFGEPLPDIVDDSTPLRPQLLYGAHKAMMEQWIATLTRRGVIEGFSLRLPGIIARPHGPSGLKSAFMSNVFHAALAGEPFVAPISTEATMWLMSVERIARNFRYALSLSSAAFAEPYAVTLPAVLVSMKELVEEIAAQTGWDPRRVRYEPDAALEAGFGSYPPLNAERAKALGFADDGSVTRLVTSALDRIKSEQRGSHG
jgi:naringenin degradation protein FdeJ